MMRQYPRLLILYPIDSDDSMSLSAMLARLRVVRQGAIRSERYSQRTSFMRCSPEAFIPLLIRSRRPYQVQISSASGSLALAYDTTNMKSSEAWDEYRMSKAALNMMTIQLHKRSKDQNMRVFVFCPGLVGSSLRGLFEGAVTAQWNAGDSMESAKAIIKIITGKRDKGVGKFVHKD